MSVGDKAKNVVQQTVGKVEESVGKRTDDEELTHQGQKDQNMGDARQKIENDKESTEK